LVQRLAGKRYALFVSTLEPRKNHAVLYNAWNASMRRGLLDPKRDRLVFVGRRGWAVNDLLREISQNPVTSDSIVMLHEVDDAQLNLIYEHAAFVLFPSHYEGFGLSVAEALGRGKFCISSDAGALPEIGGDFVQRLDPSDTAAWAQAIVHAMREPKAIKAATERTAQSYHPVTWDAAADIFFGQVVKSARGGRQDN
jgi:glycosyltransferase involved in cell wall biosynthesis